MKREELEAVMAAFDIHESDLLFHAYRAYMRDYELVVFNNGITAPRGFYSYVFRYCVKASTNTRIDPEGLIISLDDRLTDYETYKTLWDRGVELDGFVWGVKWSECYPGWSLVKDSERASYWTDEMGLDFHEILVETSIFEIRLVFSDLIVTKLSDKASQNEEHQEWLERYWSAPAPSLPSPIASTSLQPSQAPNGSRLDMNKDGRATTRRSLHLSTMPFYFLLDGEPIGMLEPVGADQGMGVIVGLFRPLPAYERIRDLFRQITAAIRRPLSELDQEAVDQLFRARDALNLTVITAGGRPVSTRGLQIYDISESGAQLDGYEAEFGITTTEFFDDPRYWSG